MLAVTEDGIGSDQERDASKISSLSPARVHLPGSIPVIQVACGLHHSGEGNHLAPPEFTCPYINVISIKLLWCLAIRFCIRDHKFL